MRQPLMRRAFRLSVAVLVTAALQACSSASAPEEVVLVLEVDAQTETCLGEMEQECLRVRSPGEAEWRLFYDPIEGFTHEAGFRYVVEVARVTLSETPADASMYRYRLLEVVSREAVDPAG